PKTSVAGAAAARSCLAPTTNTGLQPLAKDVVMNTDASAWIIPFEALGRGDVARVGGKNASLGEMVQNLSPRGVRVPTGFATTADAYWRFIDANGLREVIAGALAE